MANVFTVLAADHHEVKGILAQLESGVSSVGSGGDARQQAAERLVIEESKHEAVEEMHFWPMVRERVPGGDELADQALAQEDEGKQVLEDLRKATPGDGEFDRCVRTFARAGSEHITFEETQVWPKLRAALGAEEQEELGVKIEQAKKNAPTRPHPRASSSAGAQRAAGPFVGLADKARDAMQGRG